MLSMCAISVSYSPFLYSSKNCWSVNFCFAMCLYGCSCRIFVMSDLDCDGFFNCWKCGHRLRYLDAFDACGWLFVWCSNAECRWCYVHDVACENEGLLSGFDVCNVNEKVVSEMVERKDEVVESIDAEMDEWVEEAERIAKEPMWLRDGEDVDVIYGRFKKVTTSRKDTRTGRAYESNDFQIGIKMPDGSIGYRLINRYVYMELIKAFQRASGGTPIKKGTILSFRRTPYRR